MWDFSLARAVGALQATWPFLAFRVAVYLGIALAYVAATGVGASVGWGVGHLGEGADGPLGGALWGGVGGFGLVSAGLYLLREYVLYIVKAGHIAVLVEHLNGRALPEGRGQITHAAAVVKDRFLEANVLFGVDQLVKAALAALTGTIASIASIFPIPGVQAIAGFLNSVIKIAVSYVDEIVLAYIIRENAENPWATARDGVVLCAQRFALFLKNAVWLAIFMWIATVLIFLVVVGPMMAIAAAFPGDLAAGGIVLAIVLAWAIRAAVLEPLVIAALLQVFFEKVAADRPDPAMVSKLDGMSKEFRELAGKARAFVRPQPSAPAPKPAEAHPGG